MIAPERVAVSSFGRRRSLSDLAVWGFPEFSRKIFPLKPFLHPCHPFFPILALSSNSSSPSNAFLQLSRSGPFTFSTLLPLFFSSFSLPTSFSPFLDPYRTSSERLRNLSLRPPKDPQKALKGPF